MIVFCQTNIKLSAATIAGLKSLAKKNGLTYSGVCEQILQNALNKAEDKSYSVISPERAKAIADIESSKKRSSQQNK